MKETDKKIVETGFHNVLDDINRMAKAYCAYCEKCEQILRDETHSQQYKDYERAIQEEILNAEAKQIFEETKKKLEPVKTSIANSADWFDITDDELFKILEIAGSSRGISKFILEEFTEKHKGEMKVLKALSETVPQDLNDFVNSYIFDSGRKIEEIVEIIDNVESSPLTQINKIVVLKDEILKLSKKIGVDISDDAGKSEEYNVILNLFARAVMGV